MSNIDDFDVVVLACRPVVVTADYPRQFPMPDPHAGSVIGNCDRCGCEIYVGPAQNAKLPELGSRALVMCFLCCVTSGAAGNAPDPIPLTDKVVGTRPIDELLQP